MSKAKFDAARELISEKKYDEARRILATVDHPTAREWEVRLNEVDPPIAPFPVTTLTKPKRKSSRLGCALLIVFAVIFFIWIRPTGNKSPITAVLPTTVAFTITPGPSPTITETPLPSATLPPTATPLPEYGSRSVPYPLGQIGAIRDGQFRVNSIIRNATSAIEQMNQFNSDPDPGEEWVIVNVTFQCDLPTDKTCNTTVMQIEMVGDLSEVYSSELFAVIDNKFDGEVFGGGQKTGNIGFIIKQNDSRLLVANNDLGKRTFFVTE
jgi:hypothetical protein